MIIEFSIENFLSFKEKTTLSMIENRSTAKEHEPFYDPAHTRKINDDVNVVPVGAIYGYNATGKSNIVKAFKTLKDFVDGKLTRQLENSVAFRFDEKCKNTPSVLSIEFYEKIEKKIYIYCIAFNNDTILTEYLLLKEKEEITQLYYRTLKNNDYIINIKKQYENYKIKTQGSKKTINNIEITFTKGYNDIFDDSKIIERQTLITYLKNEKENPLKYIKDFFSSIIIINENNDTTYDKEFLGSNTYLFNYINKFELGIDKLQLNRKSSNLPKNIEDIDINTPKEKMSFLKEAIKLSNNPTLQRKLDELKATGKKNLNEIIFATPQFALKYKTNQFKYFKIEYSMQNEIFQENEISDGTKQLIEYAKLIETPPSKNFIYIIDEIETNLHRNLLKAIIKNFININNCEYEKSKKLGNQLIFTTHETSLMAQDIMENKNMLRLDEIFHIVKKENFSSDIKNFSYYKRIENVAPALELAYLENKIEKISKPKLEENKINE